MITIKWKRERVSEEVTRLIPIRYTQGELLKPVMNRLTRERYLKVQKRWRGSFRTYFWCVFRHVPSNKLYRIEAIPCTAGWHISRWCEEPPYCILDSRL